MPTKGAGAYGIECCDVHPFTFQLNQSVLFPSCVFCVFLNSLALPATGAGRGAWVDCRGSARVWAGRLRCEGHHRVDEGRPWLAQCTRSVAGRAAVCFRGSWERDRMAAYIFTRSLHCLCLRSLVRMVKHCKMRDCCCPGHLAIHQKHLLSHSYMYLPDKLPPPVRTKAMKCLARFFSPLAACCTHQPD